MTTSWATVSDGITAWASASATSAQYLPVDGYMAGSTWDGGASVWDLDGNVIGSLWDRTTVYDTTWTEAA